MLIKIVKVIEEAFSAVMADEPARQDALKSQQERAQKAKQQVAARQRAEERKQEEERRY